MTGNCMHLSNRRAQFTEFSPTVRDSSCHLVTALTFQRVYVSKYLEWRNGYVIQGPRFEKEATFVSG